MANEKRLIDLDVAIAKIQDEGVLGEGYAAYERIEDVCDMLEDCPTVDAVEVVRCKDCKHYMLWEDSDDKKTCAKSIGLMVSSPDDFCSYGERRTDNG